MWENLKRTVNNAIKPNDNREITGEKHNNTLSAVINSLGKYSQFAGLAFKNTNPGTPDGPVFYFAAFKGVYLNFNRIEVKENEVAILNYNNNKWGKIVIGYSPIAPATAEDIRLTAFIDAVNDNNALKTNFEFKQDSILGVQIPFLHAAVSHIDADGQLIKGKPTSEVLIPVPLAEPSIDVDTPGKHGFMSYQDKDLLDSIPNYTISGKKISENPILTYDDIQGVAYLGEDGKIPSSLLPSYVDDVIEYDSIDYFPAIGESGKIYIDNKTNLAYRWSGTKYVSISSSIALGETSSTAYAGDKGKKNAEDIADLKTNKADKTSVYTKEEVDYLLEHFKLPDHIKAITFSVDGILLSKNENGDLVIGGNVVVEGGISMYGPGQFGDSIMDYIIVDNESIKIINGKLTVDPNFVGGGTVKGIKVNGYTYDEVDTNGYITIPDYPTELAWNSITGKPSTFTPSAHTHTIEDITDIANASVSHATTADRLKKEIKIWGQPFDGSTDVEGAISNVDVINMANADTVISLYIKDGVLFLEGDLAVTGGITMYASNGVASGMIDQVYAVLDPAIFSKQGDYITIKGDIGGGTVKAVKVGSTQYDPDSDGIISLPEYPTVTTLEWDNILNKPSSFIPSAHTHPYLPLAGGTMTGVITSSFASGTWINGVTNAIIRASYTTYGAVLSMPVKDGRVSISSYPSNDNYIHFVYATAAQISAGTNSPTKKMYWDAANNNLHADVFTGALSGNADTATNADKLDGNHASAFAAAGHTHAYLPLSGGTMVGSIKFNGSSLPEKTLTYVCGIDAFADGGEMGWMGGRVFVAQYAPTKTGAGASGTWGISISGSAGAVAWSNVTGKPYSSFGTASQYNSVGQYFNGSQHSDFPNNQDQIITRGFMSYWNGAYNSGGSSNLHYCEYGTILGTNNYSSYALSLRGGTMTGTIKFSGTESLPLKTLEYVCGIDAFANGGEMGWMHGSTFVAQYALPLSGGTMTADARISHADGNLYLGRADNQGWLMCQDLCSQSAAGDSYWSLRVDGTFHAKNATISGICNVRHPNDDVNGRVAHKIVCYSPAYYGLITRIYTNGCVSLQSQREANDSEVFPLSLNSFGGNVGIGTIYPSEKLHVVGNILASGGITMYSDLRKKNVLSDEVLSVKEIAAAPLFRHTYKSDDNQYIHVGTSAQYWSGIHEDWFTRKDGEGYYQMELQNLGVAMGISLAREIVKYESKTDKKIRLMKKRINELEARVKELEERRSA